MIKRSYFERAMGYAIKSSYLAELKLHQRNSKKELAEIQLKRLRRIIAHSYEYIPYYRDLFDREKIKPENIKKLEDLQKIPITTKKDIQANYDKIFSNSIEKYEILTTTGSTGIPLSIYNDRRSHFYSEALLLYAFSEAGLKLRDRFVEISAIPEQSNFLDKNFRIFRRDEISLYNSMEKIIEMLKKYKPDAIYTFPSVLRTMSHFLDNGVHLKPRLIFTHGETLTESCRETINSAFGAKIMNTYGSTEFNRLAFECEEHSGLHMITDCSVIDFVKDGENVGSGCEGEIIVTGLYNYKMPLIRYGLGDIGIPTDEKCSCGRNWPLIKSIEGRSDDYLILPSGKVISPRNINVIEGIPGIIQYRTIQERKDRFVVLIIPDKDFSLETEKKIKEKINLGCLGENINIEIRLVEEIPRERTGKLKTIISKI